MRPLKRWADPSICLDRREHEPCMLMVETTKPDVRERGSDLVLENLTEVVGKLYQSDGTGNTSTERFVMKLGPNFTVRRQGKRTTECVGERP